MNEPLLNSNTDLCREARRVIEAEMMALATLRLDRAFPQAVRLIAACPGKVITSGVGKSGLVAQRIAATLTVCGTPAWFLHPTEAQHGDVGRVQGRADVLLLVSKSGESDELLGLFRFAQHHETPIIVITAEPDSFYAQHAACVLLHGKEEACRLGLTPTSSIAAAGAWGDALALVLQQYRGFTAAQFAMLHEGGALGKQLTAARKQQERTG